MSQANRNVPVYAGLVMGVVAVSFAAILIRLADAHPLVIAAYRLCIASIVIWPATLAVQRQHLRLDFSQLRLMFLASVFLAMHFAAWITSLQYTSVASSVVLVTANPLLVAAASRLLFKESLGGATLVGIALGIMGGAVIASSDWNGSKRALFGDGLALLGAVGTTGYLLVGRRLRPEVSILPYLSIVYTGAAVLLLVGVVATRQPVTGYSAGTYVMLVLVALVPQVLGHSLLNWTLSKVSATLVSVSIMAEPVVSTVLALLVLQERPGTMTLVGGVIILLGVYMASRSITLRHPAPQGGR